MASVLTHSLDAQVTGLIELKADYLRKNMNLPLISTSSRRIYCLISY